VPKAPAVKKTGWTAPPLDEAGPDDIIITHSELDVFCRCPLMWALAYRDRWTLQERPDESALSKGILYHEVMEQHYLALQLHGQNETGLAYALARARDILFTGAEQTELQALVWWMYLGYVAKYGADPQWEILGVEVKFQARLKGRYFLKGKLDLVIRDRKTLKIWIVDHKSGANLPTEMELDIADQFGLYSWLLRQAGIIVAGAIHSANRTTMNQGDRPENQDENGVPLKASMKAQTLDNRMRRTLLARGDRELDAIANDAWATAVNAYPAYDGRGSLPIYSAPKPTMGGCSWCDFLEPHLMARKGRDLKTALTEFNFEQRLGEERY
jgi:hypothetical protein